MPEERQHRLRKDVERAAERMKKAERERSSLLAQTAYLGSIAVLFVLPVLAGGYLGSWLDDRIEGYSVRWTVSLLLLGVIVGLANVYLFIRERE